jgi:DNA-binding transcriptional MocR family regulator
MQEFVPTDPNIVRVLGAWDRGGPGYLALAHALRAAILDGRLPLRARLPSERALAAALEVSRTTTTAAYDVLREEGFVDSRRGSGTRTALPTGGAVDHELPSRAIVAGAFDGIDTTSAAMSAPSAMPDAVARAVRELPAHFGGHGYDPLGLPVLRHAVAERFTARGLPTNADQVIITSGAQGGIALLLDALAAAGDAVLVEVPSYPNALEALRRAGTRLVPAALGDNGWDAAMLSALFRRAVPQLAYTIADFHNPTGLLMDAALRAALVAEADRAGTQVIVDETSVELDLAPQREFPPPLATFAGEGRVITVGSMSKAFWAGLRIGWVRAPQPVVRRLARIRAARDMAAPVLDQLVAAQLLSVREEVLRERRALIVERRDALVDALRRELPSWRFVVPRGGMCLWVQIDGPHAEALADVAEGSGLRIAPGPRFGVEGTLLDRIRIPYTLPVGVLESAVDRLAESRRRLQLGAAAREGGGMFA